jgi:hypothetical protein
VTNLSANRIRDLELRKVDWKVMKDANIVNVNYRKFDPAQWSLEESGLLGPVKLVPEKKFFSTPLLSTPAAADSRSACLLVR